MARIAEAIPKDGILVEEGLTSTTTLPAFYPYRDRKSFFGNVSGGIGWGIAAAVGVQIAEPARRVFAVIGDGSAMYSITALWSAANQKLPVIFLIMNNEGYQILKNRLKLFHGNDAPIGMDFKDPPINVTRIAEGFGVTAERVDSAEGFDAAMKRALARTDGPTLLEVMVKKVGSQGCHPEAKRGAFESHRKRFLASPRRLHRKIRRHRLLTRLEWSSVAACGRKRLLHSAIASTAAQAPIRRERPARPGRPFSSLPSPAAPPEAWTEAAPSLPGACRSC
jgi:hypothetical protein